jgi:hypothetical protein
VTDEPLEGRLEAGTRALATAESDRRPELSSIESRARRRPRRSSIARSVVAVVSVVALVGVVAAAHDSIPKRVITNEPSTSGPAKGVSPTNPTPTSHPIVPTRVLPWINKVVEPNTRDAFVHTLDASGVRGAPRCTLGDLDATLNFGGAGGAMYAGIKVRNVSPNACYVEGSPYVGFLDGAGHTAAAYSPGRRSSDAQIVLVPGSWARVGLTVVGPDSCGPGNGDLPPSANVTAIAFGIDANETRTVRPLPGSGYAVDGCPASVLAGEHTGPFEALKADNGSSLQLELPPRLTLEAPTRVRRGQTVSFSITLTGTSSNGFFLEDQDCPLYRVSLGATTSQNLLLNCGGREGLILQRGESARFDMRLTVPSDQPLGDATLRWQFIEPEHPALSSRVTVVP